MKNFDFEKVPIVEIVNEILLDGVRKGASDIHFDPSKESITIRMRVDGVLYDYSLVPVDYKRNMISRVKMIASMNIMETRLPQDGAIKSKIGDKMLDLRVSSLPTNCGEKVVLRILDYSKSLQGLETLGFSEENLKKIFKMIDVPNGIVLVTGATGSGKSTTVYSILQKLNTREVNIITVEDPVEMDIEGINQVQAQQEIGLDFANVLRSILRQDPDIIMIGEIRDGETASIAVRASITGHKVLSTIHTNSALNTIERLTDMGVERYMIGTSLNGIISQKLARKLCPNCKITRPTNDYEKELFKIALHKNIDTVYDINPNGCPNCVRGYRNRIAIAEVLFINDEVRTGITNGVDKETMRRLVYGHEGNTHTLLQDGLEKVAEGETSFDEILKLVDLENDLAIHKDLEEFEGKKEVTDEKVVDNNKIKNEPIIEAPKLDEVKNNKIEPIIEAPKLDEVKNNKIEPIIEAPKLDEVKDNKIEPIIEAPKLDEIKDNKNGPIIEAPKLDEIKDNKIEPIIEAPKLDEIKDNKNGPIIDIPKLDEIKDTKNEPIIEAPKLVEDKEIKNEPIIEAPNLDILIKPNEIKSENTNPSIINNMGTTPNNMNNMGMNPMGTTPNNMNNMRMNPMGPTPNNMNNMRMNPMGPTPNNINNMSMNPMGTTPNNMNNMGMNPMGTTPNNMNNMRMNPMGPTNNMGMNTNSLVQTPVNKFISNDIVDNTSTNNSNISVTSINMNNKPIDNSYMSTTQPNLLTSPFIDSNNQTEKIELSAVIPPNNKFAAVNLNTNEIPKNLEMFQ